MGGQRETTVASKADPVRPGQTVGDVRVHEKSGEVHFHVDKFGLKVAVPVPRWFAAWGKLRTEPGHWHFYDTERNCLLKVRTNAVSRGSRFCPSCGTGLAQPTIPGAQKREISVDISVVPATTTPEFAAVDKFTNG